MRFRTLGLALVLTVHSTHLIPPHLPLIFGLTQLIFALFEIHVLMILIDKSSHPNQGANLGFFPVLQKRNIQ